MTKQRKMLSNLVNNNTPSVESSFVFVSADASSIPTYLAFSLPYLPSMPFVLLMIPSGLLLCCSGSLGLSKNDHNSQLL